MTCDKSDQEIVSKFNNSMGLANALGFVITTGGGRFYIHNVKNKELILNPQFEPGKEINSFDSVDGIWGWINGFNLASILFNKENP